jgi:hypothetical protein
MYMQAPHDHAKWLHPKKESLAKFNAKKKAGDDNNSTNNDAKFSN